MSGKLETALVATATILLSLFSVAARAEWEDINFSALPAFCHDHMLNSPTPKGQREKNLIGPGCYIYGNHYCYALANTQRYYSSLGRTTRREQEEKLRQILSDFAYLESHFGPNCIIQPDAWLNQGRTLLLLNHPQEAATYFEKAIRKNPKFVPAYIALADLYKKSGQREVARQILEYGGKVNPTNPAIQRRLADLNK